MNENGIPRMTAGIVVLGAIMSTVDTTIVNVALHDLALDFHVSIPAVHWVVSGYLLALAIVIPLSGWAAERFGAKRVWMTAIGLFLAGSILAGLSWSIGSLIAFRVLQGLGGGMIVPVGMALLAGAAGRGKLGRTMSVLGIAQVVGPVLGPVLGGFLVEHGGWRWIFYVNVPIGALALALAARHLRADRPQPCDRLDVTGFLLLSPGLVALVYGLAQISAGGAVSGAAAGPILVGLGLVAGFVIHARRASNPLIDVRLLERRAFAGAAGTALCLGMALFGTMFLLPLYYQAARGLSPLDAGLLLAPQGLGAALMIPFAGRATDRFGSRPVVFTGLSLILLGTLPFAFADASVPYPLLAGALVIRGLGLGASMMPAMTGAYSTIGHASLARATSALNTIQRIGGSLGVALVSVVLDQHLRGGTNALGAPGAPLADAFESTFVWTVVIGALAFIPAAFLPSRPAAVRAKRHSRWHAEAHA